MVTVKSLFIAAVMLAGGAQADEPVYPSKPIHFVIPGAAGSAPDWIAGNSAGKKVPAYQPGAGKLKPIEAAPGSYVRAD